MKKRINVPLKMTGLNAGNKERNYDLKNVAFFNNGRAQHRDQYRTLATLPSTETIYNNDEPPVASTAVTSVRSSYIFNNITLVFYTDVAGGYLRQLDANGDPQEISGFPSKVSSSFRAEFEEMNGLLFVCPSYDANESVWVIEATGTGLVARQTTGTTGQDFPNKAGLCVNHRGVMFYARVRDSLSQGELVPHRIRWCAFGEPENLDPWGTPENPSYQSYEDLGEASDPIIRIVSFKNDLFVFKQQTVWLVSGFADFGSGIAPEVIREINHELGLTGPYAIAWDEEKIIFVSHMGVFSFDGNSFRKVDKPIWDYIRDLPRQTLGCACVNNEDDMSRFHVMMPRFGQDIQDDFVLCEDGQWSRWEYPEPVVFMFTDTDDYLKYYTYIGTSTGKLLVRGEAEEAVEMTWVSDWIDLGYAGMKQPRSLELLLGATGEFPVTVEVQTDYNTKIVQTWTGEQRPREVPVLDGTTITDSTPATADCEHFFHWITDLILGSCRRIKIKVTGTLLKILEAKVGYIKGTGV